MTRGRNNRWVWHLPGSAHIRCEEYGRRWMGHLHRGTWAECVDGTCVRPSCFCCSHRNPLLFFCHRRMKRQGRLPSLLPQAPWQQLLQPQPSSSNRNRGLLPWVRLGGGAGAAGLAALGQVWPFILIVISLCDGFFRAWIRTFPVPRYHCMLTRTHLSPWPVHLPTYMDTFLPPPQTYLPTHTYLHTPKYMPTQWIWRTRYDWTLSRTCWQPGPPSTPTTGMNWRCGHRGPPSGLPAPWLLKVWAATKCYRPTFPLPCHVDPVVPAPLPCLS